MFNRYGRGAKFRYVDGSVRIDPYNGRKLRTDVSATLFLTNPDGTTAATRVEDTYGRHSVKLPAGSMVVYPRPACAGDADRAACASCFFWVQSLIRDEAQRTVLYQMDEAISASPDQCGRASATIADRLLS
jgi:PKHD-type hydroxylase